eukprot:TRINITY_DN535_c1_g1_i1.p1 TRINITY_DN535_c1_g1~~TRINITY_DN535_c1_g1_i1.p1  ORF type:complete len:1661 (-),score=335.16 TRINITY_DN535_c1_g1_i1:2922-7904(-)
MDDRNEKSLKFDTFEKKIIDCCGSNFPWPMDVKVLSVDKYFRVESETEEIPSTKENSEYLQFQQQFLSQSHKIVELGTARKSEASRREISLDSLDYEIDFNEPDSKKVELVKLEAGKDLDQVKEMRDKKRNNIFGLLFMPDPPQILDIATIPRSIIRDPRYYCMMFSVKEISLSLGNFEPFFYTVSIYDLTDNKRVTEEFCGHVNTNDTMKLVASDEYADTTPKNVIFYLSTPPTETQYLIVNVYKIFKPDLENHLEMYSKSPKETKLKKFISEVQENCLSSYQYRQHMLTGLLCLGTTGNSNQAVATLNIPLLRLSKPGDVVGLIDESHNKKARGKSYGNFVMEMKMIFHDEDIPGRMDSSNRRVLPIKDENVDIIREAQLLKDLPDAIQSNYVNNMYVHLNGIQIKGKMKGKDFVVEVKMLALDNDADAPGLLNVYQPWNTKKFCSLGSSSVHHYSKKTNILEEVKMKLPFKLTTKHHLVFTVKVLNAKNGKSKPGESITKTTVGYAFLPLFQDYCLPLDTEFNLPIASKLLPYYVVNPEVNQDQWMEKATLRVTLEFCSSIYSRNPSINQFLIGDPTNILGVNTRVMLEKITITNIHDIIVFLPAILNKICHVIKSKDSDEGETAFMSLIKIVDMVGQCGDTIFESWVQNIFCMDDINFIHNFLKYWSQMVVNHLPSVVDSIRYFRIISRIIVKSMVLHLHSSNTLADEQSRCKRFPEEKSFLLDLVEKVSSMSITYTTLQQSLIDPELGKLVNYNLAHFINDLLAILDRGFVFEMVSRILYQYDNCVDGDSMTRLTHKLLFLRTLGQSSLFVLVNCPTSEPLMSALEKISSLRKSFWKQHYLVGCLLEAVSECFATKILPNIVMAVNVLSDVIWWHDNDPRFDSNPQSVAYMYFPFVSIVIDNWEVLGSLSLDKDTNTTLYSIVAYILKGTPAVFLEGWWAYEPEHRTFTFFKLLKKLLNTFQYIGERPVRALRSAQCLDLIEKYRGINPKLTLTIRELKNDPSSSSTASTSPSITTTSSAQSNPNLDNPDVKYKSSRNIFKKKKHTVIDPMANIVICDSVVERFVRMTKRYLPKINRTISKDYELLAEKHFNYEISLVILDTCVTFITRFSSTIQQRIDFFEEVFEVLVKLFTRNQSTLFLTLLFDTVYVLLPEFASIFWGPKNSISGLLVQEVLRHTNSNLKSVRDRAVSLYISLIESNSSISGNFSRVKLQSTIGVTKLAGESMDKDSKHNLMLKSFSVITKYFKKSHETDINLVRAVEVLEEQIKNVIRDHERMKQYSYDPEMICSLYYKISCQLVESPDERIAWLENLATYHKEKNNVEECAQTKIITAALVLNYLHLIKRWDVEHYYPTSFNLACPNFSMITILPENNTLSSLESEICQSSIFHGDGVLHLLSEAIEILKPAGFYETCVSAYQIMLPIYQEKGNYARQRECHLDLVNLTGKLIDESVVKQRIFSNYYRVGFYGKKVSELNGKEFIYKELNTTMLTVFTERIMKQYQDRFGSENVVKIGNTQVNLNDCDPDKLYIQIGAVEPFFGEDEISKRTTDWKRAYNINQFVMDQPFTKSGGTHGSHTDQWIRRTTFTVEKSFPFVEKRILIVDKKSSELSPIECAIEVIQNKTKSLKSELNSKNPQLKILQRDLQGSLLVPSSSSS